MNEIEDELGSFMATVTPADFSEWEWRLYNHYRLRAEQEK